MRRTKGVWVLGLMLACGGPTDAASAIAAGDWAAAKKFLNDSTPGVRAAAVTAISAASGAEATKLMGEAVLDSPNADVYKAALPIVLERALKGDKEYVAIYESALKSSTQDEVQLEAIKSLQAKGGDAVKLFTNGFKDLLSDPNEAVVAAATEAIKTLGEGGWPVLLAALTDPLSSARIRGATVAAALPELSKKHLDEIAKQWVTEQDGEVSPLLMKLVIAGGTASLVPVLKAINSVEVASKRTEFFNYLGDGIAYKLEPDPKDPKKSVAKYFCPEIAAAIEPIVVLGGKETGAAREDVVYLLMGCMQGKENAGKPEATKLQEHLEKTLKDTSADLNQRSFSLLVLCNTTGLTADTKTWFKAAQKSEPDAKVKDMYKKEGGRCK